MEHLLKTAGTSHLILTVQLLNLIFIYPISACQGGLLVSSKRTALFLELGDASHSSVLLIHHLMCVPILSQLTQLNSPVCLFFDTLQRRCIWIHQAANLREIDGTVLHPAFSSSCASKEHCVGIIQVHPSILRGLA